ncbi:MAG: hypoxanthine phosphoribosyltransferase [Phycisphaerae bacterium]
MSTEGIDRILLTSTAINRRVGQMAREIGAAYGKREIIIVPVLTGSMIFMADLIRRLPLKMRIDVVAVSSYPGRSITSRGVDILFPGTLPIRGRAVLIVDDILESGQSLQAVAKLLRKRGAKSTNTCVLLRKPQAKKNGLTADFIGFDIPDDFVVGYGMDYNHYYRNLPYIAILTPRSPAKKDSASNATPGTCGTRSRLSKNGCGRTA